MTKAFSYFTNRVYMGIPNWHIRQQRYPILRIRHRGGPMLTNMDDGGDNDASPRQFSNKTIAKWAFGIFLIMLLLALFIGTTNVGEPILPLLIGDWFFKAILFVIISSIYGLQYWVKPDNI